MKLSKAGLDLIKSYEGYHTRLPDGGCKAYLDKLAIPHVWTIGYGCTEGIKAGMVWTAAEAEAALARELEKHEAIVTRCVTVEIGQSNFDALVSFNYNTGALPKSTLLKKLNRGDFDGAAREFDRWNKAGGKVYKGLVRRRAAERAMFEQDARDPIPEGEPDMPQEVEPQPPPVGKPTIAVGAGAAGLVIPQVPPAVTDNLGAAEGWQSVGTQVASLGSWAISSPLALLIVAAMVGLLVLPRFVRSS